MALLLTFCLSVGASEDRSGTTSKAQMTERDVAFCEFNDGTVIHVYKVEEPQVGKLRPLSVLDQIKSPPTEVKTPWLDRWRNFHRQRGFSSFNAYAFSVTIPHWFSAQEIIAARPFLVDAVDYVQIGGMIEEHVLKNTCIVYGYGTRRREDADTEKDASGEMYKLTYEYDGGFPAVYDYSVKLETAPLPKMPNEDATALEKQNSWKVEDLPWKKVLSANKSQIKTFRVKSVKPERTAAP